MPGEYHLDTEYVRSFVATVHEIADRHDEIEPLLDDLREPFEELLWDDDWLPGLYRDLPPDDYDDMGEMGDDIAQWLLYREEKLALFTLVLPPGARTPVHDHLAWGLVGLYQGTQHEEFYRRVDDGDADEGHAELELVGTQEQGRGDYYELVPPEGDIHAVKTTSDVPSVSVHLLGADVGCIPRHAFDPDADLVRQFQSGYTNVSCDTELGAHDHAHTHSHEQPHVREQ